MFDTITTRRGALLRLAVAASAVAVPWLPAGAQTAGASDATAPVKRLDDALLAAMRSGRTTPFAQRFAALAPVIEQTIDLDDVLAVSVGLEWSTLPDDQKPPLRAAFLRYTVASYAANFDSYSGQTFQLSPAVREPGKRSTLSCEPRSSRPMVRSGNSITSCATVRQAGRRWTCSRMAPLAGSPCNARTSVGCWGPGACRH